MAQPIGSLQAGALHTEKVMQTISEQVARLASAVSNITAAIESRATHTDLRAAGENNESKFSLMEARLLSLERAITVRTPATLTLSNNNTSTSTSNTINNENYISVGLHVARLYSQLEATNTELAQRALSTNVATMNHSLSERLNEHAKIVSRERASQEQMARLEQAHDALSSQVSAVESACANKIDTSKLAGFETTVSRLRDFATFRRSSEDRLATLEQDASTLRTELLERAAAAQEVETMVGRMRQRLRDDTPRNDDLLDLQQKFQTILQKSINNTTNNIETNLMNHMNEMNDILTESLNDQNESLEEHQLQLIQHDQAILDRATLANVELKTDSTEHEQLENMVREGLKRRAAVRTVRTVQRDVETLSEKCLYLEKVSDISQRFMEWFHNRGSAYEQNCQTIERQLNSLVVGSDPRVRTPFVNQVRMDDVGEIIPGAEEMLKQENKTA